MTRPRKALISLADTPYYHVTSRCVRRAFLCGFDPYSGQDYEHRRQWVVDRIRLLSSLFAIDVCAYAVMSNHYHLVLKLCPRQFDNLDARQIIERWCTLFKGPILARRYLDGEPLSTAEQQTVREMANVWRRKLSDISWFMRCLNQPIARQANIEDGCTGKFWEYRFTSQALKTEEALIACMAYVDLNPVRAGLSDRPETSDYTSIKERCAPDFDLQSAVRQQQADGDLREYRQPLKPLLRFGGQTSAMHQSGLPFSFRDYLELIDWTGRIVRADKPGHIRNELPPILTRLNLSPAQWLIDTTAFEAVHSKRFNRLASSFGAT